MQWKSPIARVLFLTLSLCGPIQADEDFFNTFAGKQLSPAAQDRAFEDKVYRLLDQQAGAAAKYVQLTRFENILVITGEVKNSSHASVVDELVLNAAGIKRETPAGSAVLPEKDRECGGLPAMGNIKRKQIVTRDRDCSSLRKDKSGEARGSVYNHLAIAAPDPALKVAAANLLLAETIMELVEAGQEEVLDRAVLRLVAQDGVLYILGNTGETQRTRIKAVLMALPGMRGVVFYPE